MKTCYFDMSTRVIADLILPGELTPGWTISRINVPAIHRGKGLGTKILNEITADADAEGASLWLQVMPSGPLDYDALVAWYRRHGFKHHHTTGYMVRRPIKKEQ